MKPHYLNNPKSPLYYSIHGKGYSAAKGHIPDFFFERIIHPIGQGGFFTESFNIDNVPFSAVYDCGSFSYSAKFNKGKISPLEKFIKKSLSKTGIKNEIDLLMVSHFDADHFNGIKFLPDYKLVLIPLLSQKQKIVLSILSTIGIIKTNLSLINDPKSFFKNVKIVQVLPDYFEPGDTYYDLDGSILENLPESYVSPVLNIGDKDNSIQNFPRMIKSNIPIQISIGDSKLTFWEYIPFNHNVANLSTKFLNEIKSQTALDYDQIIKYPTGEYVKNHLEEIKNLFKDKTKLGDPNDYSMIVYSGPSLDTCCNLIELKGEDPLWESFFPILKYGDHNDNSGDLACLYTGDIKFDSNWLPDYIESIESARMDLISGIQIPHHGSKNNNGHLIVEEFNKKSSNSIVYFISADPSIRYHHPDKETIENIIPNLKNDSALHLVSTLETSSLSVTIHI